MLPFLIQLFLTFLWAAVVAWVLIYRTVDVSLAWIAGAIAAYNAFRAWTSWLAWRQRRIEDPLAERRQSIRSRPRGEQPPDPNFQFDKPDSTPAASEEPKATDGPA